MKKCILIFFSLFLLGLHFIVIPAKTFAQTPVPPAPVEGEWRQDPDVTFLGKTASRSGQLLNLALLSYKWSNDDSALQVFWVKIRNIVYILLLLVILISAFVIIITGGRNLTIIMFARRFLLVVLLITFSYALTKFLYTVVDIIQGFFIRNPDGQIISTRDLFNMSFNYTDFIGYRKFGQTYDESAFVSMLLVRLTAITYYLMVLILWLRKIILWFFIVVSPIFPLLLFHAPVRNTAKIWIGEFFRWLLYAPLFTLFLSSLVVLWRSNISIFPFDFTGAHKVIVYPTAINILLGGPGQQLELANSVNYTDTFGEYVIALIMLWVVIFLPFILLRIFLDYLSQLNFENNDWIQNIANKIPGNQFLFSKRAPVIAPPPSSPSPSYPTGMAKPIKYDETGAAKSIAYDRKSGEQTQIGIQQTKPTSIEQRLQEINQTTISNVYNTPQFKSQTVSKDTQKLVSFPIPTMRDIARFETSKTSSQVSKHEEVAKMHETLEKIANPQAITNPAIRQQYTTLREKLVQQQQKGDSLATSILNAANNASNISVQKTTTNISQISQQQQQAVSNAQQTFQKIANPQSISNVNERQQFTSLNQSLTQASQKGDNYATSILSIANQISQTSQTNNQQASTQVQETLQKIAHPETITDSKERQQFTTLKEKLTEEQKKGDTTATSLLTAAQEVAKPAATQAQSALPQMNQVQTVSLEDYEEVKKTWVENYKKTDISKIQSDMAKLDRTINLLTSKDQQKVDEGMKEVSGLLPFLLLGGFSQTEVVSYLQAKKHAAEEIMTQRKEGESEEDTLLEAKKKEAQKVAHMHTETSAIPTGSSGSQDEAEDNPLSQVMNQYTQRVQTINQTVNSKSTVNQPITLTNFSVPTMRDIVHLETAKFTSRKEAQTKAEGMNDMLQKLANPQVIVSDQEKQQYTIMRKQLTEAAAKNEPMAKAIMSVVQILTVTQQPEQALNQLTTSPLPQQNQVQTVSLEDYEEVRRTWKEVYEKLDASQSDNPVQTKMSWIQQDIDKIKKVIELLKSGDPKKIAEAMKLVGTILPFLLIGGFSLTEIITYLQAKLSAAEDVIRELHEKESEEETKIEVQEKKSEEKKEQTVAIDDTIKKEKTDDLKTERLETENGKPRTDN